MDSMVPRPSDSNELEVRVRASERVLLALIAALAQVLAAIFYLLLQQ